MFSLAIKNGRLSYKPHIPMLDEDNVRTGFFEFEQFQSVLNHLPKDIQPVIEFAYVTGWRIRSEILPLEWRQIDFHAGEIRLDAGSTKNKEGRVFPFTEDLRRILEGRRAEYERFASRGEICRWVFTREGRRIVTFRTAWKDAVKSAGCPGKLPHDLRRTAIRNMVRSGIPERVAMKLTGHKTRSVFDRYDIVSGNDLLDAARRLDSIGGRRAV
jgi:integrase